MFKMGKNARRKEAIKQAKADGTWTPKESASQGVKVLFKNPFFICFSSFSEL